MHLIVGLGNPGPRYENSRHNLGFNVVRALSERLRSGKPVRSGEAICAQAGYESDKILLAQPLTYMNHSGRAVAALAHKHGIELQDILVVCDDLDLPPGAIRLKRSGGSGGHRGIQSVIDCLDSPDFSRLRIGIGKPPAGISAADYVLMPFSNAERDLLDVAVEKSADAVLLYVSEGLEAAMNKFNQNPQL